MPFSNFIFSIPWLVIIISSFLAFAITCFVIPRIVFTARLKKLYAPTNNRTSHKDIVPILGGSAVFAGCVISTIIFGGTYFKFELQYIICGLIVVLFIGIKDDLTFSNPWKRMVGQMLAACIIGILADIRVINFYGLFGISEIPYIPSILFTVFVFLIIINGFNLIDGIDGLASGIGILTSLIFGTWFWITGNINFSVLSFSFAGSLSAFFYFNVFSKTNKIFLGDTGSLVVGFVMGILTCRFLQLDINWNGSAYIKSAPAVAIGILIIPLFDSLRVFFLRIVQGKSPIIADRQHIHHRLLESGCTHLQATLILISVNLFFITLCYSLQGIGILPLTTVIMGLASLMSYVLAKFAKKRALRIDSGLTVEGTWKKQIISKRTRRIRHINNFMVQYPAKVTKPENEIKSEIPIETDKVIEPGIDDVSLK